MDRIGIRPAGDDELMGRADGEATWTGERADEDPRDIEPGGSGGGVGGDGGGLSTGTVTMAQQAISGILIPEVFDLMSPFLVACFSALASASSASISSSGSTHDSLTSDDAETLELDLEDC